MNKEVYSRPTPVYNSNGDWSALIIQPYIYNTLGEWIGWVSEEEDVFDVDGVYVGWLSRENRILRNRGTNKIEKRDAPEPPSAIRAPATIPLPPLMSILPYGVIDVFEEEPERLHTVDTGELREDMN